MTITSKYQISKNVVVNILGFFVNVGIGLFLVPFLTKNLGMAAYGLVPLAMIFMEYINIIAQSIGSSVSRFIIVEMQSGRDNKAISIFTTALFLVFLLVLLQSFVILLVSFNLDEIISVPLEHVFQAKMLFILTFIGFSFSMFGSVFTSGLYSQNRLDLVQLNEIIRIVVRALIILSLFWLSGPSLVWVGLGNLMGGCIVLLLSYIRCRQVTPILKISFKEIDFAKMQPIATMSGWVLINTVGYLLFLRIDAFVVNRFISAEACGEYSTILQLNQLIRTAAGVLAGVVTPLSMIYYGRGDIDKLVRMMKFCVKIMSLSLAVPLSLLCGFSGEVMSFWLGSNYYRLGTLMIFQLSPLLLNVSILPLLAINTSFNKVKTPAIVTCILGLVNLLLALFIVKHTDYGVYGVAVAGAIVLTIKNSIFVPLYSAKILKLHIHSFLKPMLSGVPLFVLLIGIISLVKSFWTIWSLIGLVSTFLTLTFIAGLFICLLLEKDEKEIVLSVVPLKLRPIMKKVMIFN